MEPVVLGLCGGLIAHLIYGLTDTIAFGEKAGLIFWIVLGVLFAACKLILKEDDGCTA